MYRRLVFVSSVLAVLYLFGLVVAKTAPKSTAGEPPTASAVVKIKFENGHGSGVHIGNNLIITAAHVVDGETDMVVWSDRRGSVTGKVLWSNKDYDVALVLLRDGSLNLKTAVLDCKDPAVGDLVSSIGNPGQFEFITILGRVAGPTQKRDQFEHALVVDMTIAPGMSGGPVFDKNHRVVGIVNATMTWNGGMVASLVPIGYVVPGSAICQLLAR